MQQLEQLLNQRIYLLKLLRSQGMNNECLHKVTHALINITIAFNVHCVLSLCGQDF